MLHFWCSGEAPSISKVPLMKMKSCELALHYICSLEVVHLCLSIMVYHGSLLPGWLNTLEQWMMHTLKMIYSFTLSQCRSAITDEIWSNFLRLHITLPDMFCSHWSLFKWCFGVPRRRLFQKSIYPELVIVWEFLSHLLLMIAWPLLSFKLWGKVVHTIYLHVQHFHLSILVEAMVSDTGHWFYFITSDLNIEAVILIQLQFSAC